MTININPEFVKFIHKISLEIYYLEKNILFIKEKSLKVKNLNNKEQELKEKKEIFNLIKQNIEKQLIQPLNINNYAYNWFLNYYTNELNITFLERQ